MLELEWLDIWWPLSGRYKSPTMREGNHSGRECWGNLEGLPGSWLTAGELHLPPFPTISLPELPSLVLATCSFTSK